MHEYWGSVNGMWFTGPNAFYTHIITHAYQFIYNQLDLPEIDPLGDLNNDEVFNILDIGLLMNHLINNDPYSPDFDINSDNVIDSEDLIRLIETVLE